MANLVLVSKAAAASTYSASHIRLLIRHGLVKAEKQGGIWLVDLDDLRRYESEMKTLGTKKFTPKGQE